MARQTKSEKAYLDGLLEGEKSIAELIRVYMIDIRKELANQWITEEARTSLQNIDDIIAEVLP